MGTPPLRPRSGSTHMPDQWTETDQEIIETLLLVEGGDRNSDGHHPPDASAALAIAAHTAVPTIQPPGSYASTTSDYGGHPHPYYNLPSPRFQDGETELSEEERRAKHREVQRRFVQRKKMQMDQVRHEAANLEKRYGYLRLSMEQLALEKENQVLEGRHIEDIPRPTIEQVHQLLEHESHTVQSNFIPMREDDFSELLRETMDAVAEIDSSEVKKLDDRTRVHVMGWTGRREVDSRSEDNASMRFEISKEFTRVQPDDMVERAWAAIRTPEGYRKLFSSAIVMHVAILQRVNEDALIQYKSIFNPRTGAIQRSVDLLCRIRTNDEFLIISKGLSLPAVRASVRDPSGWCSSLNIIGFGPPKPSPLNRLRETGSSGCSFRYNSCIDGASSANLRYWLMEILFVMVRFETMLVAPLFILAPP